MFCLNQEHLIGETHNMIIEVLYSMHSFDIIFYVHCQIILQYFALFFIFLYIYKVKVTSLHYLAYYIPSTDFMIQQGKFSLSVSCTMLSITVRNWDVHGLSQDKGWFGDIMVPVNRH